MQTLAGKYCWAFVGRLPRRDMKLIDVVKDLVQNFWHDHTRPSSNQRDVLKLLLNVKPTSNNSLTHHRLNSMRDSGMSTHN